MNIEPSWRVSAHNWRQKTNHIANWNRRLLPPREAPREAFFVAEAYGAEVYVKRASGEEETVELNDGKFAQSVFEGETVTIGLRKYNGTNGDLSHSFLVTHDADNATVQNGICRDKSNVCGGGEPDCEPSDGTCSRRSADHASSPTPVQTFHLSSRMCNVS